MSEWITDRRPNVDDADRKGFVATDCDGAFQMIHYQNIQSGDPWYPIPKPYVPPKPVRRELKLVHSRGYWRQWSPKHDDCMDRGETMIVREVLEGDPTPEVIEEVASELDQMNEGYGLLLCELAAKLRGESDGQ